MVAFLQFEFQRRVYDTYMIDSLPKLEINKYIKTKCKISWVQKSLEIYLHRIADLNDLESLSESLNSHYQNPKDRLTDRLASNPGPIEGHVCIGQWSRDLCFYRILCLGNGQVQFIDFGNFSQLGIESHYEESNKDFVFIENLFYLPEKFAKLAPFAIRYDVIRYQLRNK